jgi:hypothetical protein
MIEEIHKIMRVHWNESDWKIQRENEFFLRESVRNFVENSVTGRVFTLKQRTPPHHKSTIRSKFVMLRFKEGYFGYINCLQHSSDLCYILVDDYTEFGYYDFSEKKWVVWHPTNHTYIPKECNCMIEGWSYISKEMQNEIEKKWNTSENKSWTLIFSRDGLDRIPVGEK